MSYSIKFLSMVYSFCLFSAFVGCKSTQDTGSTTTKGQAEEKIADRKTTKSSDSFNRLESVGGNTETVTEQASGMEKELPVDKTVRTGELPNGMKYYIQKNGKPENRIELRLAVNAGSIEEEDNQRGLAHFVEHMAFNGTRNFEKNELISFLESTGVRFGADLNAYTSFDETVYMLQLPTDKEGLVDKGLLVMSDWATGVTFDGKEIDKERGVIESEWRTGLGAKERMREAYWGKVFHKSKYAHRLPIGSMEVVNNAPYERLRTFYKDWYRPNLQAIIVVGDLELDEMEEKVKEKFGVLKNPEISRKKEAYSVPNHKETFIGIATDQEATSCDVQILYKHSAKDVATLEDYRRKLLYDLYNSMMNGRFGELEQDKDAPFIRANSGYFGYIRQKDFYALSAEAKEDGILESLKILLTENQRVLQHGFTSTELERAKASILKRLDKRFKEKDKNTSRNLSMKYVYHFLDNQPMMSAEQELKLAKELIPSIKIAEVNRLAKEWVTEENRTVIIAAPEKEEVEVPTEEAVQKVLTQAKDIEVEAYKDKFLDLPLLNKKLAGAKVINKKEIKGKELNVTELTLANGVRVIMKPTTFQNDQILLNAYSPGGHSIYQDKDFYSARAAAAIVDESGVGQFDLIALEKKLSDKNVNLSPYINDLYEGFTGNSSVKDFELMLKLVYLYATEPRKDKEVFERYLDQSKEEIKNITSNPMYYFYDQVFRVKFKNHPRRKIIPQLSDFDKINFERALEIYKERFSDFSDFTFVLVGSFEPQKVQGLLERYLGSLPSKNRKENWSDMDLDIAVEGAKQELKKGMAPQCNVYLGFSKKQQWTREKSHQLDAVSQVLSIMVRENLREEKGGVYSPSVRGSFTKEPVEFSDLMVIFQCAPEDATDLIDAVKKEIKDLQTNGPSEENYNKVREQQRRAREINLEKNRFWSRTLSAYYQQGRNLEDIENYDELIDKLTLETIKEAANNFIDLDKGVVVTVKPEK